MPRGRPKKIKSVDEHIQKELKNPEFKKAFDEETKQINKEQEDRLKKVVSDLTKSFGHEIIHFASEETIKEKIPFIIPEVNEMIGGGIPYGMFSILWGNKSCAKTTVTYNLIAQAQKQGKLCTYFDLENSFDKVWAEKQGVNLNRLLVGHFQNAEEAMDALIKMAREKAIDFVVLDSIQSLSPKGEQETKKGKEKSTEDDTMALLARKLSQFFRMAASGVHSGKVAVLLIGQARVDLGSFIKLETLSGGHALNHWSAITIRVHRGQKADAPRYKFTVKGKRKEIIIGFSLTIKLEKTKVSGTAPENTELRVPFYYEFGFNKPSDTQIEELYKDWIEFESEEEE